MIYYEPKTGKRAGVKNFEAIKNCLKDNPGITGLKIAERLKLSKVTVYTHLKKLQKNN